MKDNYSWLDDVLDKHADFMIGSQGVYYSGGKDTLTRGEAKSVILHQIEIEKLRARIDEMHKYAQRGTDSEIPYFNQRLADLTEKLKELEK